jgi:hypothetical protein
LEELSLSNNANFTDLIFTYLTEHLSINLTKLCLDRLSSISDSAIIESIPKLCTNVTHLSIIDCNKLTDYGFYSFAEQLYEYKLASIAPLRTLKLKWLNIQPKTVRSILKLFGSDIFEFHIAGMTTICGETLTDISQECSNIRSLSLQNCHYDLGDPLHFLGFSNLTILDISGNDLITDESITMISYRCSSLTALNLKETKLGSETLKTLGNRANDFAPLRTLILDDIFGVTDNGVELLLKGQNQLQVLSMRSCVQLTDRALTLIGNYLQNSVTNLRFGSVKHVTDRGVNALSTCHRLQELELGEAVGVTNDGLYSIADHFKNLGVLVLYDMNGISVEGVMYVVRTMPNLKEIQLTGCYALDEETIRREVVPSCRNFDTTVWI